MSEKSALPKVLIVDDEALIRWSISETLTDRGYAVAEAGDARTAIEVIEKSADPFDVVLLDYRLPDSSGLALLTKVKRLAPTAKVIMITAHGNAELAQEAKALGAYELVNKPFEIESLAQLVARASFPTLPNGRH